MENAQQLLIYRNYKILLGYKTFLIFIKKRVRNCRYLESIVVWNLYIFMTFKTFTVVPFTVGQHTIL